MPRGNQVAVAKRPNRQQLLDWINDATITR
jgi:hypothetical protein